MAETGPLPDDVEGSEDDPRDRGAPGGGGEASADGASADGSSANGASANGPPESGANGAPGEDPPALFVWAVGSFHAAALVAVGVAALHQSGAAGDLLGAVGTLPGAVAYLYLWAVTLATTRRAFRACGVTPAGGVPDGRAAFVAALLWGGVTGLAFFAGLFVALAGVFFLQAGLEAAYIVLLLLAAGGLVSPVVGALVGAVLAVFDVALLRGAGMVTGDISGGGS